MNTDEAATLVRTFNVGGRTVTLTAPTPRPGQVRHTTIEWSPTVPRRLSEKEMREYRAGRNAAVAELAAMLGGSALVIEI